MKAGWEVKTLNEVCIVERGSSPRPIKDFFTTASDGVNWIKISDTEQDGRYVFSTAQKITAEGAKQSRFVKEGDFILTNSMSFGRPYIMKTSGYIHDGWFVFRLKESLDADYFYHLLSSPLVQKQFQNLASGAIVKNISGDLVKQTKLPIPLPSEQKRIVTILDKAFENIAIAKVNAEQNLRNARELFESHLQSVFMQRGEGWVEHQLGNIADVQSGGTPLIAKKEFWAGDIPWYSSGELNKTYTDNSERKITVEGLKNSNAKKFPKGSLLIGMYDTAALKMSILDRDGAFNQAIAGVKPNEKINVEFVLHAINAIKPRLLLERRGVRQKNLSLGKIKEVVIPFPSLSEQHVVVTKLQEVMTKTQYLESIYQQKIAALDELKKSLLHKAFNGEL